MPDSAASVPVTGAVLPPTVGGKQGREHSTMTNGEVLETAHGGSVRLVLHVDEDPTNPRKDYDHLCHVASVPSGYYLPVDPDAGPYAHAWEHFGPSRAGLFVRYVRMLGGEAEYYSPQSGIAAVWYLTREDIEREAVASDPDWARKYIDAEAREYEAWADGDVYGYVIESRADWQRIRPSTNETETREGWDTVDSCWGFFGYDYAAEEAREAFKAHLTDQ